MKKKRMPFPKYEKLIIEIVPIVGCAFENKEISYMQAIGLFESAKHMFIDIVNEKFEKCGDKKNED
jgi:hypothetical protein